MITLNRFPVLGLWSKCCAEKLNYPENEAKAIAVAYATLGAIRAQGYGGRGSYKKSSDVPHDGVSQKLFVNFNGDNLEYQRINNELIMRVGGGRQTKESYKTSVENKFPSDYYNKLQESFRKYLTNINPEGKSPYKLYDQFKKICANGRLIDLDQLIEWTNKGE